MRNCLLYVVSNSNGIANESYLLYGTSLEDIVNQAEALIEEITGVSQKDNNGLHTHIHAMEDFKGYAAVIDDVSLHFSIYTSTITMKFLVEDLLFETDCDGSSGSFDDQPEEANDPFSMFAYLGDSEMLASTVRKNGEDLGEIIRKLPEVFNSDPDTCRRYVKKINENLSKKCAFDIRA